MLQVLQLMEARKQRLHKTLETAATIDLWTRARRAGYIIR